MSFLTGLSLFFGVILIAGIACVRYMWRDFTSDEVPEYVNRSDWERVSHPPHAIPFRRKE